MGDARSLRAAGHASSVDAMSLRSFPRTPGSVPDGGRRRTVRVDLGCGATKQAEFVGIDRYALPEVDMVADLNQAASFRDHCCGTSSMPATP